MHLLEEGGFKVETGDVGNVLRPETVESLYYMWRLTGERRYREWGWEIFQAFQEHAKGDVGYHSLKVTPSISSPEHPHFHIVLGWGKSLNPSPQKSKHLRNSAA